MRSSKDDSFVFGEDTRRCFVVFGSLNALDGCAFDCGSTIIVISTVHLLTLPYSEDLLLSESLFRSRSSKL